MGFRTTTRICIIGGGPAGLAVLKVLQEMDEYRAGLWELVAFEARNELGGVWWVHNIPSIHVLSDRGRRLALRLPSPPPRNLPASPLYDALTTNLPHPIMAFQSFWFEPSTALFPSASVVLKYLQDYAAHFDLTKYIRFNERVKEASWDGCSWNVQLAGESMTHQFDKVVVANGHYGVPRYPEIAGLQDWLSSERATHSMFYRNAQHLRGLTVLVIGNGPSGQDICVEASTVAGTVYHSFYNATPEDVGNIRRRGRVVQFKDHGTVVFEDGSVVSSVDHAILATGYVMSFPFLPQLRQSQTIPIIPPLPSHVINSTYNVFPLARHVFPLQDDFPSDTIAFVGLLSRVAPFPIFEVQGRYIAKVFSQPGVIDKDKESCLILARYNQLREQRGDNPTVIGNKWHKFTELEQFAYRRELLDFVEAPSRWYPEDWADEMYCAKGELRHAWVALVKAGQADEWVRGVGEGGRHEWVSMMRRLLEASRKEE